MKRPRPETTKKGGKDGSSKRRAGGASAAADARQKKKSTALKRPAPKNALRSAQLEKRELLLFRKFGHGPRLFTKYYKAQRVAPARDFALSRAAFARSLPITFRTHVSHPTSAEFVFHKLKPLQKIGLIAPIPWMPPGEGWRCLDPVADQAQAGHHRKLHPLVANAVTVGVANGVCARQEAVSMLPVLALSRVLKPGDRVLDVCAAPGNKTMQLLELVSPVSFCSKGRGSGSAKAAASADNSATKTQRSGLVVANDGNPRRVDTLREALGRHKRDVHETGSLVVTCAMGQDIPVPVFWETVVSDSGKGKGSRGGGASKETKQTKGYHAVLADVPCSGDGTLRKDPDVLKRWHPGLGNALHATQVAIATNALRLVKPGGVLLYSTCSLNPVEDEAVVAAVLCGLGGDEFDLVANPLGVCGKKGLLHRKGVHHWRVGEHVVRGSETARRSFAFACANENANLGADSEEDDCDFDDSAEDSDSEEDVHCQFYTSFENAVAAGMPCAAATMWPPPRGDTTRDLHLDRCARILPHDQDTGGFFVAMLRRREAIETTAAVTTESADHEKHRKRRLEKTQKAKRVHASAAARATADWTDPVRPLPPGEALAIAETLGVGKSVQNRLWLGGKGVVTLSPAAARDLSSLGGVAIAAAGVEALRPRVLTREEQATDASTFPYDFTVGGSAVLASAMKLRRVRVVPTDLQVLLAARAEGVDVEELDKTSFFSTGKGEILRLTPDEMAPLTKESWERVESRNTGGVGGVVLVLLRRNEKEKGDGKEKATVAFAVPGRSDENGLSISPEVDADTAASLLVKLRQVAGAGKKSKK